MSWARTATMNTPTFLSNWWLASAGWCESGSARCFSCQENKNINRVYNLRPIYNTYAIRSHIACYAAFSLEARRAKVCHDSSQVLLRGAVRQVAARSADGPSQLPSVHVS